MSKALEIAQERLAKGEISKEDYDVLVAKTENRTKSEGFFVKKVKKIKKAHEKEKEDFKNLIKSPITYIVLMSFLALSFGVLFWTKRQAVQEVFLDCQSSATTNPLLCTSYA